MRIFKRHRKGHTNSQIRKPCEDKGRDWSFVEIGQGTPLGILNLEEAREGYFLEPSEGI